MLEDHTAGDPMRAEVKWTNLSRGQISRRLGKLGTPASRQVVSQLLRKNGYRKRKALKKKTMGPRNPNRNPTWLTVYDVMRNDLGVTVVNQAVGSWTSRAVGRTGDHQVLARSKLTESYSKLYPVVVLDRAATVAEGPAGPLPLHAERPPLRVDEGVPSASVRVASASTSSSSSTITA